MSAEAVHEVTGVPFKDGVFVTATETGGGPRLIGSRCGSCGALAFPRRMTCARCKEVGGQGEVRLGPSGSLYTYALVRQAPEQFPTPYLIGYVDFDEGVRVFTQIETDDPAALRLGQRMHLVIGELGHDAEGRPRLVYRFRPESKESEGTS